MTTGFEVVVRPMILPDIRPAPPRVLRPPDDPTKGIATLSGSGGGLITLSRSESQSSSRSHAVEKKRVVDVERVYHKDDDGNIDRSQFIDTERVKSLDMQEGGKKGQMKTYEFSRPPPRDNIDILEKNKTVPAIDETGTGSA